MLSWSDVAIPSVPGEGPPLRLYDTADRQVRPVTPGRDRHDVRLRHHPLRRHPPRSRRDLPGLRPGQPALARRRARRALRAERHRRRRPAARARRPRRRRLASMLGMRETALFREDMDGAAGAAAARLHRRRRVDAARSSSSSRSCSRPGAAYVVDDAEYPDVYFRVDATEQFGYESGYDRRHDAASCSPSAAATPTGPASATRSTPLLWRAAARPASRPGRRRSARAGPAGTSSAPRSRSTGSAPASTSRAAAAT